MAQYLIQEETLTEMADAVKSKIEYISNIESLISKRSEFTIDSLPEGLTKIKEYAFAGCTGITFTSIPHGVIDVDNAAFMMCEGLTTMTLPDTVARIANHVFYQCSKLRSVTFKGKPDYISQYAFNNCPVLKTINVPWSEGEVANAPWGAPNATINYGYAGEGEAR